MPLFKTKPASDVFSLSKNRMHTDEVPATREKRTLSSKSRSKSPSQSPPLHQSNASTIGSRSFFRRPRSSSMSSFDRERSTRNNGFLGIGRSHHLEDDPSIRRAREKVKDAESAEKEADRALNEARQRVGLARQHVKGLELELLEEAKREKAKQTQAKILKKSAKSFGRHCN